MEKYRITWVAPNKKNSKRIISVAWRPMLISSKRYLEFEEAALMELQPLWDPIIKCDRIVITQYCKNKRKRDIDGIICSVFDILTKAQIIEDDNVFVVPEVTWRFVLAEEDYIDIEIH